MTEHGHQQLRVAVLGLGLVGGSVALAARAAGHYVSGWDPDLSAVEIALRRQAIDDRFDTDGEADERVDVAVVAAPVDALVEAIELALDRLPHAVVTDVGSVKLAPSRAIADQRYIGSHPLAGAEVAGIEHARGDLFAGAVWYLTPRPDARGTLLERLHRFVVSLGARPTVIDPTRHDRLMATFSHLPHVVANALAEQAAGSAEAEQMPAIGPSFRDAVRVAGANPSLWAGIYAANSDALVEGIDATIVALRHARELLLSGERARIEAWQQQAAAHRRRLVESVATGGPLVELHIVVPNRPGVIAEISLTLADAGINIHDMSLSPRPDRQTGEVALAVAADHAERARELVAGIADAEISGTGQPEGEMIAITGRGSNDVIIAPGTPPPDWQVLVPGSKSLTNRALLVAAVAAGRSTIGNPQNSDDVDTMLAAATALGAGIKHAADGAILVDGIGRPPQGSAAVYCGMAGTVGRFLVPMLAAGQGTFEVDAHAQLRGRPLLPLLKALRAQGAEIDGDEMPLTIGAHGLEGGRITVDASVSSQFVSGLMMAAAFARRRSSLLLEQLVSETYLQLTADVMAAFGLSPTFTDGGIDIPTGSYRAADYTVEPDASTASYFLAAAALTATTVRLPGLDRSVTRQGDIELVAALERMGCIVAGDRSGAITLTGPARLRGVTVDMGTSADVFMTLACVAPLAAEPTTITGIGHARVKESDRVAATAANLRRLGIEVDEHKDAITIYPGKPRAGVTLPTYDDHRIAMAFALIGTAVPIRLEDAGVVAKTCPEFFDLWRATGAQIDRPAVA